MTRNKNKGLIFNGAMAICTLFQDEINEKYNGRILKPGLIEFSPEYEIIFVNSIRKITKNFKVNKIFITKL
jgi:hypothetical protein